MSEEIGGELVPDSTRDLDIDGELDLMIEDLDLWYGSNQALYGVSLPIAKNSVTALIGPSGCGKSTTLRLINRMIEPTSGRIIYEGEDVTKGDPNELRRRMGYVIQQIGLFPHRTIAENIATVPRLLKWPKDKINARVDELLEVVSMDPSIYRDRYPSELSGGQAQRVGVARALGADPDVLLMDEPFAGVDPINVAEGQMFVLALKARGIGILITDHNVRDTLAIVDRAYLIHEGKVLTSGDRDFLLNDPQSRKFYLGENFNM